MTSPPWPDVEARITSWVDEVDAQANGRPIDKHADHDYWCPLLKDAGVRHIRLDDGRHTCVDLPCPNHVGDEQITGLGGRA